MNIVVLCGGLSTERDVSLTSGNLVTRALRELGHNAVPVDLYFGYTGEYNAPEDIFTLPVPVVGPGIGSAAPDLESVKASRKQDNDCILGDNVIAVCKAADLVFMALHGAEGENGKLQALFDIMGIKYTGCGSLASAVSMDKTIAKKIMSASGVKVPTGMTVNKYDAQFPVPQLPCVVKPVCGGSSIGTSVVYNARDYLPALELGFKFEENLIVEDYISGRECDVGVLMGKALPVIEICPKSGFYDYKNKYQAGFTDEYCPADLSEEITDKLQRAAERVFSALNMQVYARMDFIVRADGEVFCLEANTLPGMTPTSLMPQEAAAAGIDYNGLCTAIIEGSLNKYN